MSEKIENENESPKIIEMSSPSTTDEFRVSKLLRNSRGHNDQSGDWKIDEEPFCFNPISSRRPRKGTEEVENSEAQAITECYRNVFSMSVPNDSLSPYRSHHRVSIGSDKSTKSMELLGIVANIQQENPDVSENENKAGGMLDDLREYLATYQESNGTPRDEYTFYSLMKTMAHVTGYSLVALFNIIVMVPPLIQLILFILRFVLDKLISLRKMGYPQQSMMQYAILAAQMMCIYVSLVFIFGFILLPIFNLVLGILAKVFLLK